MLGRRYGQHFQEAIGKFDKSSSMVREDEILLFAPSPPDGEGFLRAYPSIPGWTVDLFRKERWRPLLLPLGRRYPFLASAAMKLCLEPLDEGSVFRRTEALSQRLRLSGSPTGIHNGLMFSPQRRAFRVSASWAIRGSA